MKTYKKITIGVLIVVAAISAGTVIGIALGAALRGLYIP